MKKNRAFTLIELLVVVAIISLLISILLPSLKEARAMGKTVACASNLKNVGIGLRMYLDENRGAFPGGHVQRGNESYIAWVPRIFKYMGGERRIFKCPEVEYSSWITPWRPNTLSPLEDVNGRALGYETGERPLKGEWPITALNPVQETFSYGYNEAGPFDILAVADQPCFGLGVHVDVAGRPDVYEGFVGEKNVRRPEYMIAIGDSVADGTWDEWLSPRTSEFTGGFPSRRHQDGLNILFVDSHVAKMKRAKILPQQIIESDTRAEAIGTVDESILRLWNTDFEPHTEFWGQ